jgi:hypothetical protein
MENFNELKHQILDCGDYFGWQTIFNADNSIHIYRTNETDIIEYWSDDGTYEDMKDTLNMAIDDELAEMTFSEPLPEYKFQIDHLYDLVNYFNWSVTVDCIQRRNLVTIKSKNHTRGYIGVHFPYVIDMVMNDELKNMGLQ